MTSAIVLSKINTTRSSLSQRQVVFHSGGKTLFLLVTIRYKGFTITLMMLASVIVLHNFDSSVSQWLLARDQQQFSSSSARAHSSRELIPRICTEASTLFGEQNTEQDLTCVMAGFSRSQNTASAVLQVNLRKK